MFLALHSGGSLLSICAHGENNVYGVSCTDKTVEVTQFSSDQYFPLTLTILMLCIAKNGICIRLQCCHSVTQITDTCTNMSIYMHTQCLL